MTKLFPREMLPYGSAVQKLGRKDAWTSLDSEFNAGSIRSLMYCAPRGMGKTTFLNAFFSQERIQQFADERKWLFQRLVLMPSTLKTDADIFVRLYEALYDALGLLPDELAQKLQDQVNQLRNSNDYVDYETNANHAENLVRNFANLLKKQGYKCVLVIDDFHHLYKKDQNGQDNLEKLASIAQKDLLSYIVASDYYPWTDLENVTISPWMRIFQKKELLGLSYKKTSKKILELVQREIAAITDEDDDDDDDESSSSAIDVQIESGELKVLWEWTGGIPGLLQLTLNELYHYKEENNGQPVPPEFYSNYLLSACDGLFRSWISRLNSKQEETLKTILYYGTDASLHALPKGVDKSSTLNDMNIVTKDEKGNWSVNCPLFGEWLKREFERPSESRKIEKQNTESPTFVIQEMYINNGDGPLIVKPVNIQAITPSALLQQLRMSSGRLPEFGSYIAGQISELAKSIQKDNLALPKFGTVEPQLESAVDSAVTDYSRQLIQDVELDDDHELIIPEEEIQTLEECFQRVRTTCRPELDDRALNSQSLQCQFYLKLSVVVEDALQFTDAFSSTDCSPQLVLYGKAFEQSLRDNLFELFNREEKLSAVDTFSCEVNQNSPNAFRNKRVRDTTIGSYCHLMRYMADYLSELCEKNSSSLRGKGYNKDWWYHLQSDLHEARVIRNLLHPESRQPQTKEIDKIFRALVGTDSEEGILSRLTVGKQLTMDLFYRPRLSLAAAGPYIGKQCEIDVERVLSNGAVRGRTREEKYLVKISKNKASSYANKKGLTFDKGMSFPVRIIEFTTQDGEDFFRAEFVDV